MKENKKTKTTLRMKKTTKIKLNKLKLKKYPRETDEETLLRLIKKEVSK